MIFSSKQISNPLSVGEKLKQTRVSSQLSLADVATKINISAKYLEAIETSNHRLLPGEVYTKNFLKSYLKFLNLNESEYLDQFASEQKIFNKTNRGQDFKKPVARVSRANLLVAPKVVRGVLVVFLALAVLGYLGGKFKAIVAAPVLVVESPAENIKTAENFIAVSGRTEMDTTLSINGQQVVINETGQFNELIDLQTGVNIIEIMAEKRHGQQTKIYRQVVVEAVQPLIEPDMPAAENL